MSNAWWGLATFGVIALVALIITITDTGETAELSPRAACQHFRNVAADAADGILTDSEIRVKLAEVERSAQGSSVAPVARALLREATSGSRSQESVTDALRNMFEACERAGH